MAFKPDQLALSREKCVEGVWIPLANYDGVRFRVRRWSQGAFQKFAAEHAGEAWDDDQMSRAFFGAWCVTEAEGLEDAEGNPLHWTPEYGIEFFLPRYPADPDDEDDGEGITWVYKFDHIFWGLYQAARTDAVYLEDLLGNS